MDEFEQFFREMDRRYRTDVIPKVRIAKVTAAASVQSYSILFPGETVDRDSIPSIAPVTPVVNDLVRIEMVSDEPVIVGVMASAGIQTGVQNFVFSAINAVNGTVNFPVSYTVAPVVLHSVQIGSNLDILSNVQTVTTTSTTLRLFQKAGTAVSGTAVLHWMAIGK